MNKYQVWCETHKYGPLVHDYDITVEGEVSKISYSEGKEWATPGKIVGELIDNGDNIILKGFSKKDISLDYMQAAQIQALLAVNTGDWKNEIREVKTIKTF